MQRELGKHHTTKPDQPGESNQGFNYPSTFSGAKQKPSQDAAGFDFE